MGRMTAAARTAAAEPHRQSEGHRLNSMSRLRWSTKNSRVDFPARAMHCPRGVCSNERLPMHLLVVLPFVFLTIICWGNYGPLMHEGQAGMAGSGLRPFVCVGVAYFLIAVLVHLLALKSRGETGKWTMSGSFWSLLAGAVGALGALGVILAFKFGGKPVYVMPLVFGGAPVVNTFVTMLMSRTLKEARLVFYIGVLLVALGAAGVLFFKPQKPAADEAHGAAAATTATATVSGLSSEQKTRIGLSVLVAALCWGSYGPVLHKGQMKMAGSRLRPFLCVGLAYFAIAVVGPLVLLEVAPDLDQGAAQQAAPAATGEAGAPAPGWQEAWMPGGSAAGIWWSLAGGVAGAVGALGVIMAFNFGGRPVFVMPLVFGGAPVMNSFTSIAHDATWEYVTVPFTLSLMAVIIGAVTVLLFAPRPGHPPKSPAQQPAPDDDQHRSGLRTLAGKSDNP
jgi:hypothetical protein